MKHVYVSILFLSSVTFVNGMEKKFLTDLDKDADRVQFSAYDLANTYRDYKERGMSKQNLSVMIAADRKSANTHAFSMRKPKVLFDAIDEAERIVFAEYTDKKQ